jgi:holo-[acyl-carrier protein] synthase
MIYGIGTDICDVRRIAAAWARWGESFARRVLGAEEMSVFERRRMALHVQGIRYLATRFSAKEAFAKAIGTGVRRPMTWHGCEIASQASGQPTVCLHGELAQWFAARRLRAHVSLSDEAEHAVSFVVVEQVENKE